MNITLATCVKNEGPYLLEWIAFHKAIGFNNFVIYSNDNDDGSDELLSQLQEAGYIQWRPRTIAEGQSPQLSAFDGLSSELLAAAGSEKHYLAWFDCDEYLVLRRHTTVQELIASYDYPDGLFVHWKHFGSADLKNYSAEPTIERFTRCSNSTHHNRLGKCISLVNPNLFSSIRHHRPIVKSREDLGRVIYCAPEGQRLVSQKLMEGHQIISDPEAPVFHEVCQLNHYAVRTIQEYAWKKQRGAAHSYNKQYKDNYFSQRDLNTDVDTYCAEHFGPMLKARMQDFPAHILACHADIVKRKILETI